MSGRFSDVQHLVRMAALFIAGVVVFLILRALLVPEGFGVWGHFRAGALDDNRARPLRFAGREACAECHADVLDARVGSKHAAIGCEACHGPLAAHAADPDAARASRPEAAPLCRSCHERNVARPAAFPQIDPAEHGGGEPCLACHQPHHPDV
jgi:hypothetical protein